MEKYVTRRQRKENKEKKRKKIIIIFLVIMFLCLSGFIVISLIKRNLKDKKHKKNKYGSESIVELEPGSIPSFSGNDYIVLNGGKPSFDSWDLDNITGEYYSDLDDLGRCGVAYAMLDRTMMPDKERGEIGQVKPTGWVQKKYEGIVDSNPPYLYNRCHLIAYALTGQNANEKNLITGTRYMNVCIMLPWEEKVMKYLDNTDNHVLYRVTPYFKDNELLARGVEMEAYSVEDDGEGICFHVFVYNVQPGVKIDYTTGESWVKN